MVYPTNIAAEALQRDYGGQLPLSHWGAQRWVARWASGVLLEACLLCAQSLLLWPLSMPPDISLH